MIRIVNAEPLHYSTDARNILQRVGNVVDGPMLRAELRSAIREYDVLIVRLGHRIDRELLDEAKHLRVIATATTGLDHIDVEYAKKKGIEIISLRGETEFLEGIHATAEHTWALLLALLRKIVPASLSVRDGVWDRDRFRGGELHGKRLGIVGLGRIGRKVARYGLAFGMSVLANDPHVGDVPAPIIGVRSLEELAGVADVLSVHVPLARETERLVNERILRAMPCGGLLINTSRGAVIDEPALVEALESGHLAGAAVDVVSGEGMAAERAESPLIEYGKSSCNLLITPHIAGATHESMRKTEVFIARKIEEFLEKQALGEPQIGAGR